MRVLIVHNRYRSAQPSGENAVVDEESRLLAEAGHTVDRLELESDAIAGWPLRRKATLPFRVIWSREGYRLTQSAIRCFSPTIVHFHNTFPLFSPSALWAAHRAGAVVVITLHNFRPICPAGTLLRDGVISEECVGRFPWPAVRYGCYRNSSAATLPVALMAGLHQTVGTWFRCVDRFVVPTKFTAEKYVEAGWPADKIAVKFNTAPDPGIRRNGAGSGFACVSRLAPEKGVHVLLRAWSGTFPPGSATLDIVGAGELEDSLQRQARDLEGVNFRGALARDEVNSVLSRVRALVVPSLWYEVFPRVVLEAYAVGVPVIASRLGSLAEVVEDGKTGILVKPASWSELAQALRDLSVSDEMAKRLGTAARGVYEERYSPARTLERLLVIYEEARAHRARNARVAA